MLGFKFTQQPIVRVEVLGLSPSFFSKSTSETSVFWFLTDTGMTSSNVRKKWFQGIAFKWHYLHFQIGSAIITETIITKIIKLIKQHITEARESSK